MNKPEIEINCQIKDIQFFTKEFRENISFKRRTRLIIREMLGPKRIRKIKIIINNVMVHMQFFSRKPQPMAIEYESKRIDLKPGDLIRVRSKEEIATTLNYWGQLKGCSFAPEMMQYCETTQKVLKCVERFVDERDLRIRKAKGIVILDGINCQGTATLGRCDRNCYYFWRVEWLESIPQKG